MLRENSPMQPVTEQDTKQDDALMLMSLALDGMLSQEEEAYFQFLLASDATFAATWDEWQLMDARFTNVGYVEPPADFVSHFEMRLAEADSSKLWWNNFFVIAASLLVWGAALVAVSGLGVHIYFNQAWWASTFIHNITGLAAAILQWMRASQIAINSAVTSPQTMTAALGYCCAGAAILLWWIHWLRANTLVLEIQQ